MNRNLIAPRMRRIMDLQVYEINNLRSHLKLVENELKKEKRYNLENNNRLINYNNLNEKHNKLIQDYMDLNRNNKELIRKNQELEKQGNLNEILKEETNKIIDELVKENIRLKRNGK